jgi:hypothetical protein
MVTTGREVKGKVENGVPKLQLWEEIRGKAQGIWHENCDYHNLGYMYYFLTISATKICG